MIYLKALVIKPPAQPQSLYLLEQQRRFQELSDIRTPRRLLQLPIQSSHCTEGPARATRALQQEHFQRTYSKGVQTWYCSQKCFFLFVADQNQHIFADRA